MGIAQRQGGGYARTRSDSRLWAPIAFFSQDLKTFRRDASGGRDGVLTLFAVWAQLGATAGLHRVLVEEIERHPGRKWLSRVTALADLSGQVPPFQK